MPTAPVVTKPATQTSVKNIAIESFQVVATETPTEYKATGLPTGLSIVAGTGVISGTPTTVEKATVKLSAKNATGTGAEVSFSWEVEKDPNELETRITTLEGTVSAVQSIADNPLSQIQVELKEKAIEAAEEAGEQRERELEWQAI